jgi:hypothetical protein
MPPPGFEPAVPAGGRPHIHALDRAATGIVIVHVITHPKPNQSKLKGQGRRINSFHLAIPACREQRWAAKRMPYNYILTGTVLTLTDFPSCSRAKEFC